jgi:hypothetical protein
MLVRQTSRRDGLAKLLIDLCLASLLRFSFFSTGRSGVSVPLGKNQRGLLQSGRARVLIFFESQHCGGLALVLGLWLSLWSFRVWIHAGRVIKVGSAGSFYEGIRTVRSRGCTIEYLAHLALNGAVAKTLVC